MTARFVAVCAAAASALVLSACAIETPPNPPAPQLENLGAVLEAQSDAVIAQTRAELTVADAAGDASLLTDRVGGDALQVRTAEYVVKAGGGADPTVFPEEFQAVYGTDAEAWPRIFVGVTQAPADDLTPLVMLWVQDDVATGYELREWAQMVPGAVLPAMPGQPTGSPMLGLDADGLAMTPAAAIEAYQTILTEGTGGASAALFAPDAYRDRMFAARDALAATAKKRKGEYKDEITARADEAFVLRTGEGGALVFLPVTVTSTFKVPGAQLTLPAKDKALLSGTLKDQVIHYYFDFVVINVPAAGTTVLPSVVAADHHLVNVTIKPKADAGAGAGDESGKQGDS